MPCDVGDRIKEVRAWIRDIGRGQVGMHVDMRRPDGSNVRLGPTKSSSAAGNDQVLSLVGLNETIDSGDFCHVILDINNSNDGYRVYGVEVTYDRTGIVVIPRPSTLSPDINVGPGPLGGVA